MNSPSKRFGVSAIAAVVGVTLIAALAGAVESTPAPASDSAEVAKNPHETSIRGKIDEVTVYRGQALVTRLVEIPGPAGLREIVVGDLPQRIEPGSIYAESADGVEVRSVLYRIRPVERDVREEVRKLDDAIRNVQDQVRENSEETKVLEAQSTYLDKLEQFTAPTARAELTKGVLNAETLKTLTSFQFDKRADISTKQLKLSFAARDLNDKLNLFNRQREQLTSGSAQTLREAVVFVQLKHDKGRMRLRYLVGGATWDPSYNVRTDAKHQNVMVEYNAAIEQMSGEDWNDVAMTLSTATPSLVAKAPVLEPLTIALHQGAQENQANEPGAKGYYKAKRELDERRQQIEITRNATPWVAGNEVANGVNGTITLNGGTLNYSGSTATSSGAITLNGGGMAGGMGTGQNPFSGDNGEPNAPPSATAQQPAQPQANFDTTLNEVTQQSQVLDLVSSAKVERAGKPTETDTAGVTVGYQLAGRTSLPSRTDRQLIQIAALPMKADFYKIAEPVLTSYVYDEASVVNSSKSVLLAGPVSTYVAGQFVGHGEVPTVAVGESFSIGLGIDSSLRAHRELMHKTESIQGGNRVVDFTYQIGLENFGSEPTAVRLFDRMPAARESEVKLTLVEPGKPLSSDTRYEQQERKKGLLRWDVTAPPQSIGTKMFTLNYQMQMEYDKQLSIASLPMIR